MDRVKVENPIVNIDGDQMAQVIWSMVTELVTEHVDVELIEFDLGLPNRDRTGDEVTVAAARSVLEHGVGVRTAVATPTTADVAAYGLRSRWPSANVTIRNALGGAVFREPIVLRGALQRVPRWRLPIVVARHAYGDEYRALEVEIAASDDVELVVAEASGDVRVVSLGTAGPAGPLYCTSNTDDSIRDFATTCFQYALMRSLPVRLGSRDSSPHVYEGRFADLFREVFEGHFVDEFEARGLDYSRQPIDELLADVVAGEGGLLWACRNYDGDIQSEFVAQGFGSPLLMTSIQLTASGRVAVSEVAHAGLPEAYAAHLSGETTSVSAIPSIFTWSSGLRLRAHMDDNAELRAFASVLERACSELFDEGCVTGDLLDMCPVSANPVSTAAFVAEVAARVDLIRSEAGR